jgi:arsenate reductase (thioredoxin)
MVEPYATAKRVRASRVVVCLLAGLLGSVAVPSTSTGTPLALQDATANKQGPTVLFLCPHGAGKSVLASAYFQQLARERGLNVRVDAAGVEPQEALAPIVVERLRKQGLRPLVTKPRAVTPQDVGSADVVISMGCDLKGLPVRPNTLRQWDDVPGPSEDLRGADDAIRRRVTALVEELLAGQR